MRDDDFEWDDAKARANIARHGVSFEAARDVFDDLFSVGWMDDRENHHEARYVVLGLVDSRLLSVIYTIRNDRIRLISARGAEPRERRIYHEKDT